MSNPAKVSVEKRSADIMRGLFIKRQIIEELTKQRNELLSVLRQTQKSACEGECVVLIGCSAIRSHTKNCLSRAALLDRLKDIEL